VLSLLLLLAASAQVDPSPARPPSGAARHVRPGDTRPPGNAKAGGSSAASLPARYFGICDRDGDHSISFPEAKASLGLDQKGFAVYDADGDGLISLAEFKKRYKDILALGGTFPPPKAKVVPPSALPASAEKVLEDYDKIRDGALDAGELDAALVGMGASKIDPDTALSQFDHDGSGRLETEEIEELLSLLRRGSAPKLGGPRPKSIDELFGALVPRKGGGTAPEPPKIIGPVSSFRRLDIDGDGRVTREELSELQRPWVLNIQSSAVLAALDADGDGAISDAEFWAAMGGSRPEPH
jgi:Ca2+-binding EF-hand superfamily protein